MKERNLTGWNFQRIVFSVMGIFIIIQSISDKQWFGLFFGAYFASMGIFRFGCASGNCYGGACYADANNTQLKAHKQPENIVLEEVKTK